MSTINTYEELVAEFVTAVIAQSEAMKRHDVEAGNRLALKYCNAGKQLIGRGSDGHNAFARLLDDPRAEVRAMAAAFLIPYRTNESRAVLELSAQGSGTVPLGAKLALQRWDKEGKGIDFV